MNKPEQLIGAVWVWYIKPWLQDNKRGLIWSAFVLSHLAAAVVGYNLHR